MTSMMNREWTTYQEHLQTHLHQSQTQQDHSNNEMKPQASGSAEDIGNWLMRLQNALENEHERLERGNKETYVGELPTKGPHQVTRPVAATARTLRIELEGLEIIGTRRRGETSRSSPETRQNANGLTRESSKWAGRPGG